MEEPEPCPVCDVIFRDDDLCAMDVNLGTCHAACLEDAPIVDINTGEPMPEGSKAFTVLYGTLRRLEERD